MTLDCKCGGRFKRTDLIGVYDSRYKRVMTHDMDPLKANWKCDKCGKVRTQRKRQPKVKA